MKRLVIATSLTLLALPLCAQTATTDTAQDSPLVAAAKASKKTGGKGIVITNDNLVRVGGGHMSVATATPGSLMPSFPHGQTAFKQEPVAKTGVDPAAQTKKDAAAKREANARSAAADLYGENIETRIEDPAMQERMANQMTSTQPQPVNSSQPQTVPTNPKPPEN